MQKKKNNRQLDNRVRKLEIARDQIIDQLKNHHKELVKQNEALHKWAATVMPMVELGLQSTALMTLLLEKELITEEEIQNKLNELQENARKVMDQQNEEAEAETISGEGDTEETDSPSGE